MKIVTLEDQRRVQDEMPVEDRWSARTLYQQLAETAGRFPDRPAVTFQLKSGPRDKELTLSWAGLLDEATRGANLLRRLGIGPADVVAYVLPNCLETAATLLAGATAGIVSPVNPLLSPEHIGALLRETRAKVVVTLAPFPKSDLAEKVAAAVALAPDVEVILEVDLKRYLAPPLSWIVPLIRPKTKTAHHARVLDLRAELAQEDGGALSFAEADEDRICAYFHTGGTTGMPKIARHRARGILYNGWCGKYYMFTENDVMMCPLPLFHVFAAYPIFMSCLMSGARMILPTPQGYRGEGVFENFWKLIERYKVSFLIIVPTAAAKLMQQKVDADISSLRLAISGSAAMPVELFHRFEAATGLKILEGYGITEATCLVAINPTDGERRIGSVGFPFAYTDVRILRCSPEGEVLHRCAADEVGEICVKNPGVSVETYTGQDKNRGLIVDGGYLRTGDLGRLDGDGYVWITGRAKDMIIRGGHNIDPALIEEAAIQHPDVAFVGAIGEPDARAGEIPAAYIELREGATVTEAEIKQFLQARLTERAALPHHIEFLDELPKTAVGKVFKPDLRRRAIQRVYDQALEQEGLAARVMEVVEDSKLGLVAVLERGGGAEEELRVGEILGSFVTPWRWSDER